jgi:hypothetical protein
MAANEFEFQGMAGEQWSGDEGEGEGAVHRRKYSAIDPHPHGAVSGDKEGMEVKEKSTKIVKALYPYDPKVLHVCLHLHDMY